MNAITTIDPAAAAPFSPPDLAEDVDRLTTIHRQQAALWERKAREANSAGKERAEALQAEKRRIRTETAAVLKKLDEDIADTLAAADNNARAAERMAASSRAALEALKG